MLYFLQQMHNKDRDRLERGQVAFDLQAIYIFEAGISPPPTRNGTASGQQQTQAPESLVTTCHRAGVQLTVAPLEAVFWATDQVIPVERPEEMQCLQKDLHCLLQVTFQIHIWTSLLTQLCHCCPAVRIQLNPLVVNLTKLRGPNEYWFAAVQQSATQ